MTGYKDKTWCSFWKTCVHGRDCHRALTPDIYHQANNWNKGEYQTLIITFAEIPGCFDRIPKGENT